ncbi:hypothetical protein, partial [Acinetobacter indicus]|uniref:hypothetical protein n=1 Tax=Acinetobacter indicus TaxID=756892 RepID=UPI001C0812C6
LKEVVVLLSVRLFIFFLCFFLLMMLVEGVSTGSDCDCSCNFFLYLVLVGMLWVFPRLVLLMQGICTGSGNTELAEVLKVLVVLLLFLIIMGVNWGGNESFGSLPVATDAITGISGTIRVGKCIDRLFFLLVVVEEIVVVLLFRHGWMMMLQDYYDNDCIELEIYI